MADASLNEEETKHANTAKAGSSILKYKSNQLEERSTRSGCSGGSEISRDAGNKNKFTKILTHGSGYSADCSSISSSSSKSSFFGSGPVNQTNRIIGETSQEISQWLLSSRNRKVIQYSNPDNLYKTEEKSKFRALETSKGHKDEPHYNESEKTLVGRSNFPTHQSHYSTGSINSITSKKSQVYCQEQSKDNMNAVNDIRKQKQVAPYFYLKQNYDGSQRVSDQNYYRQNKHQNIYDENNRKSLNELNSQFGQIRSPMDPRIELGNVEHISSSDIRHHTTAASEKKSDSSNHKPYDLSSDKSSTDWIRPSIENYVKLLEVCKPFFGNGGKKRRRFTATNLHLEIRKKKENPIGEDKEDAQSSSHASTRTNDQEDKTADQSDSGSSTHTSFLVTTSLSGSKHSWSSNSSFSSFSKVKNTSPVNSGSTKSNIDTKTKEINEDSDSSSMVVLARSKKKHKYSQQNNRDNQSNTSNENKKSHQSLNLQQDDSVESEISNNAKTDDRSLTLSKEKKASSTSSSSSPSIRTNAFNDFGTISATKSSPKHEKEASNNMEWEKSRIQTRPIPKQSMLQENRLCPNIHDNNNNAQNQKNTNSNNINTTNTEKPTSIVTDTSASDSKRNSNTSSSSGSGNGSSGSGNGSGGSGNETNAANENSTSTSVDLGSDEGGSGSGSGSGSGGDNGVTNRVGTENNENADEKGKTESYSLNEKDDDQTKKISYSNETERLPKFTSNENYQHLQTENKSQSSHKLHSHATNNNRYDASSISNAAASAASNNVDITDGSHIDEKAHQQKLLSKKRKRMNMRREYEEQQHYDSSDTSIQTVILQPGKPVTLEDVLVFTKSARLVIQATPPFLVVHANAAYAALSGFDSHHAIGKPISTLMSLPDKEPTSMHTQHGRSLPTEQLQSHNSSPYMMGRDDSRHATPEEVPFEVLVAYAGFGCHHEVNLHVCYPKCNSSRESRHNHHQHHHHYHHHYYYKQVSNNSEPNRSTIPCIMGVSPVVSSKTATLSWDKKMHGGVFSGHYSMNSKPYNLGETRHDSNENKKLPQNAYREHLITHFAVQLDAITTKKKNNTKTTSTTSITMKNYKNDVNGDLGSQVPDNAEGILSSSIRNMNNDNVSGGMGLEVGVHRRAEIDATINAENIGNAHIRSHGHQLQDEPNLNQMPLPLESTDDDHSSSTGPKHVITCG